MANIEEKGHEMRFYDTPKIDVILITQDVIRTSNPEGGGEDNADWWS